MVSQIKGYLSFLKQSTTKYGVHSPFVYTLITTCFNVKHERKKSNIVKAYKYFLRNNKELINVTDYGAGSKIFKTNERRISAIAKNAGISTKRAELLTRVVRYFDVETVLEIGTSLGIGTLALALGNEDTKIKTLEGCIETVKTPQTELHKYVDNKIDFIVGEFESTLPKVTKNQKYDLVYFDGNHKKEPTITYFEQCLPTIHNDTVFIFDDIHWSKDMEGAWEYIKNHKKVRLTMDTFNWGFVFFRKEQQEKEHFTIRI